MSNYSLKTTALDKATNAANITTLQSNVTTLQGNVTTLQGNVTTLQSSGGGSFTTVTTHTLPYVGNKYTTTGTNVCGNNVGIGHGVSGPTKAHGTYYCPQLNALITFNAGCNTLSANINGAGTLINFRSDGKIDFWLTSGNTTSWSHYSFSLFS